jgi:hypothetical protein
MINNGIIIGPTNDIQWYWCWTFSKSSYLVTLVGGADVIDTETMWPWAVFPGGACKSMREAFEDGTLKLQEESKKGPPGISEQ